MTVASVQLSLSARLGRWLLSDDPATRTRTALSGLAWSLMAVCVSMLCWLCDQDGIHDMSATQWWGILSLLGMGTMTVLIRLRRTQHWRDPSLTVAQMVWALTTAAMAYLLVSPSKDLLPCMVAIVLLFGAMGLNLTQIVAMHGYAVASTGTAMLLAPWLHGQPLTELEVVHPALLAVVVVACMAVSLRLHRLRTRLQQQREALAQALEEHRTLASRDVLTGLLNRRSMHELLELERCRCLRGTRTMALAILDIDHFKRINDTYGHCAGDRALQTFAQTVRQTVRSGDVLARWGGEEFVLLLNDLDSTAAQRLLERIGMAVAQVVVPDTPATLRLTVSAGLTIHRPGEPMEATLERADRALYRAKHKGRNCVVLADAQASSTAPSLSPSVTASSPPSAAPLLAPTPAVARSTPLVHEYEAEHSLA